ncbi:hypothetical protein [Nocardioides hwasunensis]|uniref:Uncharacterized protein n=1 Tax=Nocardioides hwasunensis TaxID=397258 RepID=A0ABR8MLI8_9ACTN|nr:hypothetical protein [Nocardioides hwasunensis]MBD3916886.1 hypothetical protein [Nocardioides hwasunensis]
MDTHIDWQSELDASFGRGEDVAVPSYVGRGRRALRRRRAATVVAAGVLVVGGGAAWASIPGSAPRSDAPVATRGTSAEREATEPARVDREERRRTLEELKRAQERIDFLGNPAALTPEGLMAAPGTTVVLERVHNPMGYRAAAGSSMAIRATFRGRETYSLMALTGTDSSSTISARATGDFPGWLASTVATQRSLDEANGVGGADGTSDGDGADGWLRLDADGKVEAARSGVVVVEQRTSVDLADFDRGAEASGVVRLVVDGDARVAAYRVLDSRLEVISGPGHFATLTDFVDWARQQYASGEGMR